MSGPRALIVGTGYAGQRHAEALRELAVPRLRLPIDVASDAFAALARPAETLQVAFSYPDA